MLTRPVILALDLQGEVFPVVRVVGAIALSEWHDVLGVKYLITTIFGQGNPDNSDGNSRTMAATPQFIKSPTIGSAVLSVANTNLDGTGTMAVLATGSTKGTVIRRVVAIAQGTVTDGFIRLFLHDGSTTRFYAQIKVSAATPSATVAAWESELELMDLVLPSGHSLRAATYKAESFAVHALGGEL